MEIGSILPTLIGSLLVTLYGYLKMNGFVVKMMNHIHRKKNAMRSVMQNAKIMKMSRENPFPMNSAMTLFLLV